MCGMWEEGVTRSTYRLLPYGEKTSSKMVYAPIPSFAALGAYTQARCGIVTSLSLYKSFMRFIFVHSIEVQ